jgi:uncharacterized protein YmfQ (DUF2313 family)
MSSPTFTNADFQTALWSLLPRGRVWLRDPGSMQDNVLASFAPTFARNSTDALNLLVDAFPATALDLLPEWEATLGLPDPCTGPAPTIQQRRAQVVARLVNPGGQSIPYFINLAAALGFTVTITQYAPFRLGQNAAGQPLGNVDWYYAWSINAPDVSVIYFRAGSSSAGDALAQWSNEVLECEIRARAPAHTVLQFHYYDTTPYVMPDYMNPVYIEGQTT